MREEQGYIIIESVGDLLGWEILHVEEWKEGVVRLYLRRFFLPPAPWFATPEEKEALVQRHIREHPNSPVAESLTAYCRREIYEQQGRS